MAHMGDDGATGHFFEMILRVIRPYEYIFTVFPYLDLWLCLKHLYQDEALLKMKSQTIFHGESQRLGQRRTLQPMVVVHSLLNPALK